MRHLSIEARQSIVEKALQLKGRSVKEIAEINNIGYSTLQKWIQRYKNNDQLFLPSVVKSKTQITPTERFQHLLATSNIDESVLGAYCREHGLYSFQLQEWKTEFMTQNKQQKSSSASNELKLLRAENKRLKQELRRKESALAETAALLVLKKKATLLWGSDEDV